MLIRIALVIVGIIAFLGLLIVGKALLAPTPMPQATHNQTADAPHTQSVLTLRAAMSAGSFLKTGDLISTNIPDAYVPSGAIVDTQGNRQSLEGALLRLDVPANAVLVEQSLLRAGDHGFLSAVLKPGMRAVSLGVNAVSGVSGLIEPGDHVDVLMTEHIAPPPADTVNTTTNGQNVAKIVLSNIRVVAVGGSLSTHNKGGAEPATIDERAVTLELTPEQTGIISVAQQMGQIALAVQSLTGEHNSLSTSPVWGHSVSALDTQQQKTGVNTVHVYNGTAGVQDAHF